MHFSANYPNVIISIYSPSLSCYINSAKFKIVYNICSGTLSEFMALNKWYIRDSFCLSFILCQTESNAILYKFYAKGGYISAIDEQGLNTRNGLYFNNSI